MNLLKVKESELIALAELKKLVQDRTAVEKIIVFGSVARGEATDESDLDVLILTKESISYLEENSIFDTAFFVNLKYDTNISVVVVPKEKWDSPIWSLLPLYREIAKEGIAI